MVEGIRLSGQRITSKHLQLLIALQEGPMDTLEQIANRVGISRTTVSKDLKLLSGEGSKSAKRYFRVVPDFDEPALGLETFDVFFSTPTHKSVEAVEKLCFKHPYTKYKVRCYGGENEVFAQFRMPIGTRSLLREFLEIHKKEKNYQDYRIIPTADVHTIFTIPSLEYWDNESFSWTFDFNHWFSLKTQKKKTSYKEKSDEKLHLLSKNDIWILSRLADGVRRKQKTIIEDLKGVGIEFSSQEFSRRLQLIKEEFITRYHVYVDVDTFDLYSNVILTANVDQGFSKDLEQRILTKGLPFRSTLKLSDSFLFWYLRLPSRYLSMLLNRLHSSVSNLRLKLIDYQRSDVFKFWPEAFDESRKKWKTDESFLLL